MCFSISFVVCVCVWLSVLYIWFKGILLDCISIRVWCGYYRVVILDIIHKYSSSSKQIVPVILNTSHGLYIGIIPTFYWMKRLFGAAYYFARTVLGMDDAWDEVSLWHPIVAFDAAAHELISSVGAAWLICSLQRCWLVVHDVWAKGWHVINNLLWWCSWLS